MPSYMTPRELSDVDDISTSLVLDPYLRFTTHKMNATDFFQRQSDSELRNILDDFIKSQDFEATHVRLIGNNKILQEHKYLKEHIYRYLRIFTPEAGFKIVPCYRYSSEDRMGAKVIATRKWYKNERIPFLVCYTSALTTNGTQGLIRPGQNDFSLMYSCRRGCDNLFLGPASFLNHNCEENCEYEVIKPHIIGIKLIRDVDIDLELTTFYGKDFFNIGNQSCECTCCESLGRGAFSKSKKHQLESLQNQLEKSAQLCSSKRICVFKHTQRKNDFEESTQKYMVALNQYLHILESYIAKL